MVAGGSPPATKANDSKGLRTGWPSERPRIRNISNERGGVAGTGTWNWTQALNAFAVYFPRRLEGNPR